MIGFSDMYYSKKYQVSDLVRIIDPVEYRCDVDCVGGVTIDTRVVSCNNVFVAIKGNRIDGHNLVNDAYNNGARYFIVDHVNEQLCDKNYFIVGETKNALRQIAQWSRDNFLGKIIAVTGSVGKSTTKDWLSYILSNFGKTQSTLKNKNCYLWVDVTLANFEEDSRYGVVELGMNHRGEISSFSNVVKPHIALITKICSAHIGNLLSLQNIAYEKCDIVSGLVQGGILFINRDEELFDDMVKYVKMFRQDVNIVTFGWDKKADYRIVDVIMTDNGWIVSAGCNDRVVKYKLNGVGRHFIPNTIGILGILDYLKVDIDKATKYFEDLTPCEGRGMVHVINTSVGDIIVIDETYNANPESMKAAIENLGSYVDNRKIAVLGDMLELGDSAAVEHTKLVKLLVENRIDKVYCFGSLMRNLFENIPRKMKGECSDDIEVLLKRIVSDVKKNDVFLVKGSHNGDGGNGCMYPIVERLLMM